MKKALLVVAVLMAAVAVKAQNVYVGGSFSLWRNSTENYSNFTVAPEVGYNFSEKWAIGTELAYSHDYNSGLTVNSFAIAPYVRWSYYENGAVRLFLDGTATVGFNKVKDVETLKYGQVGFRPGIAVKLSDKFSFVAKYGFLGYQRNVAGEGDAFGLDFSSDNLAIGFHYNF